MTFIDPKLNSYSIGRMKQNQIIPGQFRGIGGTRIIGSIYNYNTFYGSGMGFDQYNYFGAGAAPQRTFWDKLADWTMGAGILGSMAGGLMQIFGAKTEGKGGVSDGTSNALLSDAAATTQTTAASVATHTTETETADGAGSPAQTSATTTLDEAVFEATVKTVFGDDLPEGVNISVNGQLATVSTPYGSFNVSANKQGAESIKKQLEIFKAATDNGEIKGIFKDEVNGTQVGNSAAKADTTSSAKSLLPDTISVKGHKFKYQGMKEIEINGEKTTVPVYKTVGAKNFEDGHEYALINGELVQPKGQKAGEELVGTGPTAVHSGSTGKKVSESGTKKQQTYITKDGRYDLQADGLYHKVTKGTVEQEGLTEDQIKTKANPDTKTSKTLSTKTSNKTNTNTDRAHWKFVKMSDGWHRQMDNGTIADKASVITEIIAHTNNKDRASMGLTAYVGKFPECDQ